VENVEDLRTLIDLGCHCAQSFLFSRPMDSLSFIKMLRGRAAGSKPNGGDAVGLERRA
jgi:EAL domain-containing protein (putative c-di-GMP-specific phosphodiesterase class I)